MNSEERKSVGQARKLVGMLLDRRDWSRHDTGAQLQSLASHLSAAMDKPVEEVVGSDKEQVWGSNGRRVVVLEAGEEGFIEVAGQVVKVLFAPKAPKPGSLVLKAIADRAKRPRMSLAAENKMWQQYWREHDRQEVSRNGQRAAVG